MRILGEEHDDCDNWSKWVRDLELGRGYPRRWPIPVLAAVDGLLERDRLFEELEAQESVAYSEPQAMLTDRLFRIWLDECRLCGKCWGKRYFMILRGAYLLHRDMGEMTVREALRALADLKARIQCMNNPLAERRNTAYDGGQGELRPDEAHA